MAWSERTKALLSKSVIEWFDYKETSLNFVLSKLLVI